MSWAVKTRRLSVSPIAHMARPAGVRRERILSAPERGDILALYPEGDPFRDLLVALAESGARPGEIIRLTAADVDLAGGVATLAEHKTGSKTGAPRTIYLTADLSAVLARLVALRPAGPLLRNADGNPWTLQAINCRFRRKRARKVDPMDADVTAYVYRSSWTTDALENEVPIATVAELLGHTSTAMVSKHYSKLAAKKDYLRRAAQQAVKKPGGDPLT
jgi:integrase